jgi:hypothetical protein
VSFEALPTLSRFADDRTISLSLCIYKDRKFLVISHPLAPSQFNSVSSLLHIRTKNSTKNEKKDMGHKRHVKEEKEIRHL